MNDIPICVSHGEYLHNYSPILVEGISFFDSKEWKCLRCGKIITLAEWKEFDKTVYKSPYLGNVKS